MKVNVYGEKNLPKILLLHPMELTGAELYQILSPYIDGEYCIISPDQGAHGDSGPYLSQKDEYEQLTNFLVENHMTEFRAVYAESMGCTLAVEMIADERFTISHIWLDGGCLCEDSFILYFIMKTMFLGRAKKLRKKPDLPLTNLINAYGENIGDMMRKNFVKYSDEDIKRISYSCTNYQLKHVSSDIQKRMHIEWGEKDRNKWLSRKGLTKYYPNAEVIVRENEGHCTFMAQHTAEYMMEFNEFIRK